MSLPTSSDRSRIKVLPQQRYQPCRVCGHPISQRHHVFGFAEFGEGDPGTTVYICANCHELWHLIERAAAGGRQSLDILSALIHDDDVHVDPGNLLELLINVRIAREIVRGMLDRQADECGDARARLEIRSEARKAERQHGACRDLIAALFEVADGHEEAVWRLVPSESKRCGWWHRAWFNGGPYNAFGDRLSIHDAIRDTGGEYLFDQWCGRCGKPMQRTTTTVAFEADSRPLIEVTDTPAWRCVSCGQTSATGHGQTRAWRIASDADGADPKPTESIRLVYSEASA